MTTTTETKVEVAPGVLAAVKDFLKTKIKQDAIRAKAELTIESKYWPMVEQSLVMFEEGLERETIQAQFRAACEMCHDGEVASRHRSTWRLMAANVTKIAYKGREWVEEQKGTGLGFWAVLKLITDPTPSADDEDGDGDEAPKAKPTKSGRHSTSKAKKTKKSGNVNVRGGGAEQDAEDEATIDLDSIMEYIEASPKVFAEIVGKVLETALIDIDDLEVIYNKIGKHLDDSK
jgi:hypothetical protein